METNMNERESSLSPEKRKKLTFAKLRLTKKKYRFAQPANVKAKTEHENSSLDTVLATVTGGHYDSRREQRGHAESGENHREDNDTFTKNTERVRRLRKAEFIRGKLQQEENIYDREQEKYPAGDIAFSDNNSKSEDHYDDFSEEVDLSERYSNQENKSDSRRYAEHGFSEETAEAQNSRSKFS